MSWSEPPNVVRVPTLAALKAERERRKIERARESFREFVRSAWHLVDPHPMIEAWYIDAIADHLQAVTAGQIRNLVINIPPRFAKSTLGSVLWPAWSWIQRPSTGWLTSSHSEKLAVRDAVKARRLIESPWFIGNYVRGWAMQGDQNAKMRYENTAGGYRLVTSVEAKTTGDGGDITLCDDPLDARDAYSPTALENALVWWREVWSSRVNDPKTSSRVLIMQRIAENDPSGEVVNDPTWERLILPQEYSPSAYVTRIGWRDPRTKEGELLCPERMGIEEVARAKATLGSAYSGQHNQRPNPREGRLIKRHLIGRYPGHPVAVAATCQQVIMTVDCAFTDAESSDPVGIHVWGRRGAEAFLLDRHVEVMDFLATCAAVRRMSERWPRALAKWIERKANGHAVIASMSKEIPGLAAWPRKGSQFSQAGKVERVNAVLPAFEAGNVRIPEISAWSAEVEDRWCAFPVGHDEDTDCMTMALIEFYVSDGLECPTPDEQMEGLRALLEMR